jgi:hypothetical protein
VSKWLHTVFSLLPAIGWAQEVGQSVALDQQTSRDDPVRSGKLNDYARALVEQSDWPIAFENVIVITSGSGGYQLNFRLEIEAAREDERTPREEAYDRLTHEEREERWQAMVCSPDLLEIVEQESFTAVLQDDASRRNYWSGSYACGPEEK